MPESIAVPDLVNLTQSEAEAKLRSVGLGVGTVMTVGSATTPNGSVSGVSPTAGTVVNSGSAVNLQVSSGPANGPVRIAVPDLVNLTQSEAEAKLRSAGLGVGTVTTVGSATTPNGSVSGMNPTAGTLVDSGSAVNLEVSSGSGSLPKIIEVKPDPLNGVEVRVQTPPFLDAGVRLARLVLGTAAGSIVLLLAYLIWMDLTIGLNVQKTYDHVLNPSRIGSEFYTLGRLERLAVDLTSARKDPNLKLSAESTQNAEMILTFVQLLPSVTLAQKTQLKTCIPTPEGNTRNEKLDACVSILESIRQAALEAAAGATNASVASDSVAKINEHRQSLHTFWIQAAQLILLNLLLPLLTALFGYIFGTQQAQRTG